MKKLDKPVASNFNKLDHSLKDLKVMKIEIKENRGN